MATIQALRFHDRKDLRLDEIPRPPCGPQEVRLKIAFCGICGSDIHEYLGGPIFPPQPGQKNPHTGLELPVIMGHEMSGTILEVGSMVKDLTPGQDVTINPSVDDRHHNNELCQNCRVGRWNICAHWACYGLSAPGGGLADEIVVNVHSVIPLPPGVSLKAAALAEPLAVASHMIRVSGFDKGDNVLVLGAGPIGLALLLLLKARGAGLVLVSEIAESRAQKAKSFGADSVINPVAGGGDGNNVVDAVLRVTEQGVDVAFDATGIQSTLDTAIAAVRPGGTIFNVAIHEKPLLINPNSLTLFEKKYTGGICYTNEDFKAVLDGLASGSIPAEEMVTAVVPLKDVIEGAFEELINHRERHVKILVQP